MSHPSALPAPTHQFATSQPHGSLRSRATRLAVSTLARIAPAAAEEYATRRFLRPTGPRWPSAIARGREEHSCAVPIACMEIRIRGASGAIAADLFGEPGPTVLLVHGWSGSAADMATIALNLVAAGYRAVTVDLPAHGRSDGTLTTLPEMMRAIATVAVAVGPLAGVVAHSLGAAATVLALNERQMAARGVVLLAPAIGPMAFVERYRRLIGLPRARVDGMVERVGARAGRAVVTLDARSAASRLASPVLIVHDPEDREVPFDHGKEIADAWQGSRMLAMAGVGHRRVLRDERVLAAINDFLTGVPPVRAAVCAADGVHANGRQHARMIVDGVNDRIG
jgi:pimeloyl-ACP methyl ester carboxylesterase